MIFGINTTRHISKFSQITYKNFEISLVVFMPNITTNHSITYTNTISRRTSTQRSTSIKWPLAVTPKVAEL